MRASSVVLFLCIVLLAGIVGYLMYEYQVLENKYTDLQASYNGLKRDFEELQNRYAELESEHEALRGRYGELKSSYSKLEEAHASLQQQYAELQSKYSSLEKDFMNLLVRYNKLQSDYSDLLSKHYELENRYAKLENRFTEIEQTVKDRAGLLDTWPRYIDYKSYEVTRAVNEAISALLGNPYTKIYNWIKNNIEYNYDTPLIIPLKPEYANAYYTYRNYVQYASETVKLGRGDCEDQAILAAAMVLNYWERYQSTTNEVYVVLVEGYTSEESVGHAFTIILTRTGKIMILDPAGSQITGLDLWIFRIVEPKDIYEAIHDYVKEWKKYDYTITRVYAVFNQDTYKKLDMSIDDFIKWLYQQTLD